MTLEIVPVTDEAGHASWYATMVEAHCTTSRTATGR